MLPCPLKMLQAGTSTGAVQQSAEVHCILQPSGARQEQLATQPHLKPQHTAHLPLWRHQGPLLQGWGSAEAAQQLSTAHMAYCCAALVHLVQSLTKGGLEASPQLLSALLQGVSTHLDSPLPALK